MELRENIPNFISGCEPNTYTFETIGELLDIPYVKDFRNSSFDGVPFWRYSESKYGDECLLMAEWKNSEEHHWWVVGYMTEGLGFPQIEFPKRETVNIPHSPTIEEEKNRSERVQLEIAFATRMREFGLLQDEIPPEQPWWAKNKGPTLKRQEVIDSILGVWKGEKLSYIGTGRFGFQGGKEYYLMDDSMLAEKYGERFGVKVTITDDDVGHKRLYPRVLIPPMCSNCGCSLVMSKGDVFVRCKDGVDVWFCTKCESVINVTTI